MKIREKLSLLTRKAIDREIGGQMFTFYPISLGALADLRTVGIPIFKMVKSFFSRGSLNGAQTVDNVKTADGAMQSTTHMAEPSIELVRLKIEQEEKLLTDVVQALLGDETRMMLGRLLADSLREEFGPKPKADEVKAFIDEVELPVLVDMLGAFLEVNTSVFGPLAPKVREMVQERIQGAVAQAESPVN